MQATNAHAAEVAELEKLAVVLTARGLQAQVRTVRGRLPYLDVRNPRASVLAEKVFAQAGQYWWSWAKPIGPCEQVTEAALMLTRVLRTVGEEIEPGR